MVVAYSTLTSDLCAVCVQIAVLHAFGYDYNQMPERIQTEDAPNGVALKTIYNHKKKHETEYRAIEQWCSLSKREQKILKSELTVENYKKKFEEDLGISYAVIKEAIVSGDAEAAKWHIEQVIGKAKQTTKHEGAILHGVAVFNPRPIRELAMQENDMLNSQKLLRALPAGVLEDPIEAEIVS